MTTKAVASIDLYDAEGNLRRMSDIEIEVINLAMNRYGGSVTEVSRRLRIGRSTLYRKLERYEDVVRRQNRDSHVHPIPDSCRV